MKLVQRLKWLTAMLLLAGITTSAILWGGNDRSQPGEPPAEARDALTDLRSRFASEPVLTYQSRNGETYFALQLRPQLPPVEAIPRDMVILIDASASQAGGPFEASKKIAKHLLTQAKPGDRASVWFVSTPKATRNLSREEGLIAPEKALTALGSIDKEYASGAVDLPEVLTRAAKDFELKSTRQQVLVYLGDGESALNPMNETVRLPIIKKFQSEKVAFYAVPLGPTVNGHNLHSLVTATGGLLVRPQDETTRDPFAMVKGVAERLDKATKVPVIESVKSTLSGNAAEMYPTQLPPLRADVPTLVVGRFAKDQVPAKIDLGIQGTIHGQPVKTAVELALPKTGMENYFLVSMVKQWGESGRGEAPAVLRADRTLALAYENTRIAREEFLEQAEWALGSKRADKAKMLFEAALKIDPENVRAEAGMNIIGKLDRGELTYEKLLQDAATNSGIKLNFNQLTQQPEPKDPPAGNDPSNTDAEALLKQELAKQKIREQQTAAAVEESVNRARDLLKAGDPKGAKDLLMAQRDTLRVTSDLGDNTRQKLLSRVQNLLSEVGIKGDEMIRQRAEENERIARARQAIIAADQEEAREEKIRERIASFGTLMSQARFEDAYREALQMENEFVVENRPIPVETFATYRIGQSATNYRDQRELVRLREDRFLLQMLEVEKAHMPFPDEPPVHFPPAKVWRDLTAIRKSKPVADFDADLTPRQRDQYKRNQKSLLQSVTFPLQAEAPLKQTLSTLQRVMNAKLGLNEGDEREVRIVIRQDLFVKEAMLQEDVGEKPVRISALRDVNDRVLGPLTASSVLKLICESVQASYWVTPDSIQIVPVQAAAAQKYMVYRVYPIEDLIVPVPNAFNSQQVAQQIQLLGGVTNAGNGGQVQFNGAFNGGNNGGGGGGAVAGQIAQNLGNFQGFLQFQGGFGFGGGVSAQNPLVELLNLMTSIIDPGYWDAPNLNLGAQTFDPNNPNAGAGMLGGDPMLTPMDATKANRINFLVNARAMVILGRSRNRKFEKSDLGTGEAVINLGKPNDGRQFAKNNPAANGKPVDPELAWQQLFDKNQMKPKEVIACAEILMDNKQFGHVVEVLKNSMRQGVSAEAPFQEALALALELNQGAPEEIERARLSAVDLNPTRADSYLSVAKVMHDLGNPDRAIQLCKIAATLEPNVPDPYVNSLVYAGDPKAELNSDVVDFAAGNLLGREWLADTNELHQRAKLFVEKAAARLKEQNRGAEAEKVQKLIKKQDKVRDLVIEIAWSGKADLDLQVTEPIGSTCSSTQMMTPGGGVLSCDHFEQADEERTETYSASSAFGGTYTVKVDRVWGATLGNKVRVKVVRNQGTPEERVEFHTLTLQKDRSTELHVQLPKGSRHETAKIPTPSEMARYDWKPERQEQAVKKLNALLRGNSSVTLDGGVGTSMGSMGSTQKTGSPVTDFTFYSPVGHQKYYGMEFWGKNTIRADGNVQLTVQPVFDSVTKNMKMNLEVIPGSGK
ncbi:MAG: VWA domain-containing protein [Zavarzinella sp.]